MSDGVQPFSNGTEFAIWEDWNCGRCVKAFQNSEKTKGPLSCDLDKALTLAYLGDGKITNEQANRLGYIDGEHQGCAEVKTEKDPKPLRLRKPRVDPNQMKLLEVANGEV